MKRSGFAGLILFLVFWLTAEAATQAGDSEEASSTGCRVEFTYVPPLGSSENLQGRVVCDEPNNCTDYQIAVYIYVPPYGWWTKPLADEPITTVEPDCTWTCDITIGGRDWYAVKIIAFLVPCGSSVPVILGEQCLPDSLFEYPYAEAVRYRQISFSGYDWWVKRSCDISQADRVGPGPNYFTDSNEHIWVDSNGHLHLQIVNVNGKWYCSELIGEKSFGYGTYILTIQSRADLIDENIVFGFFTWEDCVPPHYRELDVELTQWSNPNEPNNLQYVVMPDLPGHKKRFNIDYTADTNKTTYIITWTKAEVSFRSYYGDFSIVPPDEYLIACWSFTNSDEIPEEGVENPRINFWLNYGNPPNNGQNAEFIVTRFKYLPDTSPLIDFADFALFADSWFEWDCNNPSGADLDRNCDVNTPDLKILCENWLKLITVTPYVQ
jgi:hypothetical protein